MRQVPNNSTDKKIYRYLIIGNGRAAKHTSFYLNQLGHQVLSWHYKSFPAKTTSDLLTLFKQSDRCLLLIKDSALEDFLNQYPELRRQKTVHFSGSLKIEGILNAHPLISFGNTLFEPEFYQNIPWAQFMGANFSLAEILPGIPNTSFYIPNELKPLYHGLCVTSGNFTVLLWQMVIQLFKNQLNLPSEVLLPYLESIMSTMRADWKQELQTALTGPIARHDEVTLLKNYHALQNTVLNDIFKAHVKSAWPEFALKYFNHDSKGN